LEKIVKSVKKIGKNILDFCKHNSKGLVFMGVGLSMGYLINTTNAERIMLKNSTTASNINKNNFYVETYLDDANEMEDNRDIPLEDVPPGPYPNDLMIYSFPYDVLETDARPWNTPGIEFFLEYDGSTLPSGGINNSVKVKVLDSNGLEHRKVMIYDLFDSNNIYEIPKDGSIYNIPLPNLTQEMADEEIYGDYFLATPALVPGDITSSAGVGILDGKSDIYDLEAVADNWLNETLEGENYSWGDVTYDRITNFQDYVVISRSYGNGE